MVIVLTGAAACGSSSSSGKTNGATAGTAAGSTTGSAAGSAPASGDKTSASKSSGAHTGKNGAFKGLDFCKTLSAESLTAIGLQLSDGKTGDYGGCKWDGNGTEVEVRVAENWPVGSPDTAHGDKEISILGYSGITETLIGNSCDVSMQVEKDKLEVNVQNISDVDNPALAGGKACDVAKGFTEQVLAKVKK